jgi:hypothetical protein
VLTAGGRAADPICGAHLRYTSATGTAKRPFHEAMSRRTRRARYSRQVFGLAGAHSGGAPSGLLKAAASQSWATSAVDGGRSCIPLRDSPGFSRVPSYDALLTCFARCRRRVVRRQQTSCVVKVTLLPDWPENAGSARQRGGDGDITVVEFDGSTDGRVVCQRASYDECDVRARD